MAYKNKYQRQKQQYSTDGGSTWIDVSPANYRRGRLLEAASEDCNTVEWREVLGSWFCIEFEETIYRWVDSGTYDCVVGDKYPIEKEQVSHNGGSSWEDTGETRYGEVIRNSADCSIDYDDEYFTIEIMSDTATIYVNHNGLLEYKIDNGDWQVCSTGRNTINATLGQKIQWRGRLVSNNTSGCSFDNVFVTSNNTQIKVYGNINSVYEYDTLTNTCYNYSGFFNNNDGLIDAENLILPAETLIQYAYLCMFNGCDNLVTPPELPSTTLANDCYSQMFKGCISMTTAPELPATTLTWGCYYQMFGRCKSLTSAPDLPATSLAEGCYAQMFQECTSLVNAPSTLPATRVYNGSYQGMFKKCIALTTAPQILATTLDDNCFWEMFRDCVNLVNIPLTLPATTLADYCYHSMFQGCTSLTTAPILPAGTFVIDGDNVANYAYYEMFQGCTSLNYIKMMIANVPSGYNLGNFTSSWVYQVAATGTFVKNGGATWNEIGNDGVPRGWTIEYDGSATRWVDTGTTVCQGRDKYTVEKEQVTTDGGQTWTDTGDTRTGTLIQRDSQECLYASDYLTITSLANNNNIYWINGGPSVAGYARTVYISTDGGTTWTNKLSQRNQVSIATLNTGDKLLIKGSLSNYYSGYVNHFTSDYTVDLSGNIMSLLYGDNFVGQTELTAQNTFKGIFSGLRVVNAQNLVLPATTLTSNCYARMFLGCTSLVTAPKLPAVIMTLECYDEMFYSCTSLTTAPELPATTLAQRCYNEMFNGCSSLNYIKMLATDISASNCLNSWVSNVSATGTFVKSSSMTTLPTGRSGIPSGWTVQDA